jgi:hypothetical protein
MPLPQAIAEVLRLNTDDNDVAVLVPERLCRVQLPLHSVRCRHDGMLAGTYGTADALPWNELLRGLIDRLRDGPDASTRDTFPTNTMVMLWACLMLQQSTTGSATTITGTATG